MIDTAYAHMIGITKLLMSCSMNAPVMVEVGSTTDPLEVCSQTHSSVQEECTATFRSMLIILAQTASLQPHNMLCLLFVRLLFILQMTLAIWLFAGLLGVFKAAFAISCVFQTCFISAADFR